MIPRPVPPRPAPLRPRPAVSSREGRARPKFAPLAVLITVLMVGAACGGSPASDAAIDPPPDTPSPGAGAGSATVARIVDGDTLVARAGSHDERVRLIGIDTPETKKPDTPVECFGPEAADHLRTLLPEGSPIWLQRDVEARDRYGRLLAYVHRPDKLFVNRAMLADGFAAQLTIPPNVAFVDDFTAAAREAREARRGLWEVCRGPHDRGPPRTGPP